jgi:hypothetical protein
MAKIMRPLLLLCLVGIVLSSDRRAEAAPLPECKTTFFFCVEEAQCTNGAICTFGDCRGEVECLLGDCDEGDVALICGVDTP